MARCSSLNSSCDSHWLASALISLNSYRVMLEKKTAPPSLWDCYRLGDTYSVPDRHPHCQHWHGSGRRQVAAYRAWLFQHITSRFSASGSQAGHHHLHGLTLRLRHGFGGLALLRFNCSTNSAAPRAELRSSWARKRLGLAFVWTDPDAETARSNGTRNSVTPVRFLLGD
jgi:hypothetical protein